LYIDECLEGDVGKITPEQRKLLEEAFTSSERMVHLIGDFLDVSRLQTGKFMIEFTDTDICDLVQQEVDAIQQIAAAHGIFVQFKKRGRIPKLHIDENKIHQVVMNFIDNAIYYSPDSSDPINVSLCVEDGSVVLRVVDNGMGVPKAEQKQLFTKFFRAKNARNQRPDGTGVGLFLAKKVIDGHGGKLIFESTEGQGSTFGFRLPIKKLTELPARKEPAT
jgi:signal transduction histidine kinase